MTPAVAASLASYLFVLAYLLWSDWAGRAQRLRNRRTASGMESILVWGLTFLIPIFVSVSVGLAVANWPQGPKTDAAPTPAPVSALSPVQRKQTIKCTPSSLSGRASTLECEVIGQPAPIKSETATTPSTDSGPKFELLLAALGVFVAMVTAISMAVAKNATDEARRAAENVNELRSEFDHIAQSKQRAVLAAVQAAEIHAVSQLTRSNILGLQLGINPTPLFEEKLRVLGEMMHWGQADFLANKLANDVESLLNHLDNPLYLPRLKTFFNERDAAAYEAVIQAIREESHGAPRSEAVALSRLLRRIKAL